MKGRAVVLTTDTVISPFGDPAREAYFSGETIEETQRSTFARMKFERVVADDPAEAIRLVAEAPPGRPVLLLLDRIYLSEKAAKDFLKAARQTSRPAALSLTLNASVDYTLPLQSVRRDGDTVVHDVLLVDGATLPAPADGEDGVTWLRRIEATAVDVPKREIVAPIPLPTIGEREKATLLYPITSTLVVSVEHWVHVLWLNQIAFGVRWVELLRRKPLWGLWRALTTFSLNKFKLLDRLVYKSKGASVHPSAYVSASILGEGVKIGANASVRNSIVGAGAVVQDHAVLLNCVVGEGALIRENAFLVSNVIYPEATVGNYKLQVCLIGRGAYINNWASFVDAKFIGHVKVNKDGALVSSERAFLGSVIGHRAKMAAKMIVQCGREIPNDTVIVMRPDEIIHTVPEHIEPGRPHVRDRGTLVPLGEES